MGCLGYAGFSRLETSHNKISNYFKVKKSLLMGTVALVPMIGFMPIAQADDFVISTPETTTNGGVPIDGDDTLTITGTGSITTTGARAINPGGLNNRIINNGTVSTSGSGAEAVSALNDNHTVINNGTLNTSGSNSAGVEVEELSTIINNGVINTSGDGSGGIETFDGNNTITNAGTLSTSGESSDAINVDDNNSITSTGTIQTTGDRSEGIAADNNNMITNTGTISTSGDRSDAINADDNSTIANSGSISTTGERSHGIFAADNSMITNSGGISTSGRSADGIEVQNGSNVINNGTITTIGDFADGIYGGETATYTFINNGSIITNGFAANGIAAEDGSTLNVTNTGSITIHGDGSGIIGEGGSSLNNTGNITIRQDGIGISVSGGTITNSGRVVSFQGHSIRIQSNGNMLNLNAPSFLGGAIDFSNSTNTTVNITSGPSHSILWDLSTGTMNGGAPNLSGPVPIFYNPTTQRVATFDPTALSGGANVLGDISGNLSGIMRGRLSRAGSGSGSSLTAYSANYENTASKRLNTAFGEAGGADNGWWISGFGSHAEYDGNAVTTLDYEFDHTGFAIGYDWEHSSDLILGAMIGYGWGAFDTNSRFAGSFDNSADGLFGAFYGRSNLSDGMFVDFGISGGMLSHSNSRFVNDNLAALGVSSASADYDSWYVSPELKIGMDMGDVYGNGWHYMPSASLRYAMQSVDGYTETGPSAANATVNSHDIAMMETRLELAAMRETDTGTFTQRVGWQHRSAMGDEAVNITMIGQTNSVGFASEDSSAAYLGLDAGMELDNGAFLNLGGEFTFGNNVTAVRGMATLKMVF